MRTLDESKTRWEETLKQSTSFPDLQRAVKFNGPSSPCVAGCRSVCWKAFLLFKDANAVNWSHVLLENRDTYGALREHYLKFIKQPALLTELSLDPLADDPDSPWTASRQDESIRNEILQDVQRLPDEPFYHQEAIQTMILDILFIWVKLNPDQGGYRQGMHELLAPLLYVVDQDAIDRKNIDHDVANHMMVEMLDSYYIEHDTFALFSKLMEQAKPFYEVSVDASGPLSSEQSAIVEKSKQIHEIALMRVDPELANHLKAIEVLPQIFLIRWIRLMFGREFPFEQLLILWDTIFAYDPTLELIDLVCVSMLIRIRWTLLEADYSNALQLLLKYPAPEPPHGPHTFVDDALYLKDHYNTPGGSSIIMKYTGRTPNPTHQNPRPTTPESKFPGLSLRSRAQGAPVLFSPLTSPGSGSGSSRHSNNNFQRVEPALALFQGAAKNVIERGEKLGINQAVRDAMGEIRRNMQDLRVSSRGTTPISSRHDIFTNGLLGSSSGRRDSERHSLAAMEQRNRQLASLLGEAIAGLQAVAGESLQGDRDKSLEAVEMAAAKAQFVKIYLEDSSLDLNLDLPPPTESVSSPPPQVVIDDDVPPLPTIMPSANNISTTRLNEGASSSLMVAEDEIMTDPQPETEDPGASTPKGVASPRMDGLQQHSSSPLSPTSIPQALTPNHHRPAAPIPTRSTLAQSSFSLMLDAPDQLPSLSPRTSSVPGSATSASSGGGHHHHRGSTKRPSNAFLFGEVVGAEDLAAGGVVGVAGQPGAKPFTSEDIFGLEPLRRPSKVRGKYEDLFGGALGES